MAATSLAPGATSSVSDDALLVTKLHLPTLRSNLVSRPHLVRILDRVPESRLTLISAPPGFGKTTLLAEWVRSLSPADSSPPASAARPSMHLAWLSLDASDNDPVRFWVSVLRALQTGHRDVGSSLIAALRIPQPPRGEGIVAGLINEIAELSPAAPLLVLVLDDYHVIENRAIHAALAYLVDNLPPRLRLIVATRADPPLPLARYRSRGQLIEIGADDLRFSVAEATDLFVRTLGAGLSPSDVTDLVARTEGWIAGLQLAALSLLGRSAQSMSDFVRVFSGSHRYVLDYLVEEVLNRQPPAVQDFMLCTSILDRLSGSLCDAVTGRSDGQVTLERLEKANLFLSPLDDCGLWIKAQPTVASSSIDFHLTMALVTTGFVVLSLTVSAFAAFQAMA
jgi:LuxR family maltose regulon positive regulatory protein